MPVGSHVLSLFSYPSPGVNTFILPTCDLPLYDLNWWFPSPNALNAMVLIPDTASSKFLWSLSVFSGYQVVPSLPTQLDIVVIPVGGFVLT
jgi:hypothetical protein